MVKRLLAGTFFLHLWRKSSGYTNCSTLTASQGQGDNPMEVATLTPAHSCEGGQWEQGQLHHRLWGLASRASARAAPALQQPPLLPPAVLAHRAHM